MTKARSNAVAAAAKGDLTIGTGTNLSGILPVSSQNGDTIVADSSTSSGLRYQGSMAAGRNLVINGGFDIWQRGTSFAVSAGLPSAYSADRWQTYRPSVGSTVSRQVTGDSTNLPFIQYCARVQRNSGNTALDQIYIASSFESVNSIPFAGKAITFSFYARAGSNYSATSNVLKVYLGSGTGTDQSIITGFSGPLSPVDANATLTTTWQRFSFTATISSTATQLGTTISFVPTGTAGANDFFEITGIQLEVGSVATQFSRAGATIQGELAACQRYFFSMLPAGGDQYRYIGTGTALSATFLKTGVQFPVTMRTTPTLVSASGTDYYRFGAGDGGGGSVNDDFNSFTINQPTPNATALFNNSEISTVQNRAGTVFTNNTLASLAFSAEL